MAIRTLSLLVSFAGATATAYLALLAARLVWDGPQLLLTFFSDAELVRTQTFGSGALLRFSYLQPTGGGFPLDEFYLVGPIGFTLTAILLAAFWRRPALQLGGAFVAFWLTVWLSGAAFQYFERASGPINDAIRALPAIGSTETGRKFFGAAVCLVGLFGLIVSWARISRGSTPMHRFGIVLLLLAGPIAALTALIPELRLEAGWLGRRGFSDAPLFFAGLAGLFALATPSRGERQFKLGESFAGLAVVSALIAYVGVSSYAASMSQPEPAESYASQHWTLHFEQGLFTQQQRREWASNADRRVTAYALRLDASLPDQPIEAFVMSTPPERRRGGRGGPRPDNGPRFAQPPEPPVRTSRIVDWDGEPADPREEVMLLMAALWGPAESEAIARGIARFVVGDFFGHDLAGYARRLAFEERPYNLAEILETPGEYLSPLVRDALAGAWVGSVVNDVGSLQRLYHTPLHAVPARLDCRAEDLEGRWQRWLSEPAEALQSARPAAPEFQRGVSFSSELGGRWGYGSESSRQQLSRIHETGANAVAVVPYAFTMAPEDTRIRIRSEEGVGRTARTIRQAKQAGLAVTLKPHLWSNRFTGDIEFREPEDFRRWFSSYRRWILHFARMAELENVEMFVIGNELGGVTSFEKDWRGLIRDVRRIYSGPVTYASHWSGEFEEVAFWDELDFIGLNFYFPLARLGETPRAGSEQVHQISGRIRQASERFAKQVIFTEVGFPSLALAAFEPWRDDGSTLDLELQKACYDTLFEAFYEQPWLSGMYWWKWPSHGRGGRFDGRHNPIGKPALAVMTDWYGR